VAIPAERFEVNLSGGLFEPMPIAVSLLFRSSLLFTDNAETSHSLRLVRDCVAVCGDVKHFVKIARLVTRSLEQ
jgi:ABC-type dipeptide/oligopeptide/nickel transport system ATPase component